MVVGGYGAGAGVSEIIDLSGQSPNCPAIRSSPLSVGAVGTFINNKTLVCGGYNDGYTRECYYYDMQVENIN